MELTGIRAHNYTALRATAIEVPTGSRVVLIAGPNGAGKTALIDGIRFALTGHLPRGLQYKKELPELITEGESEGAVGVNFRDADGRDNAIMVKLKTGNANTPPPLSAIDAYVMSPQQFIALEPSKRRKVLFDRAGISLSIEAVSRALQDEGHEAHVLAKVTTAIKAGFDAGAKRAKELAAEARGAWQATTGENYGSAKALEWVATAPAEFENPEDTKAALDEANAAVARAVASRDLLKQAEDQHVRAAARIAQAADLAQAQSDLDLAIEREREQGEKLAALDAETSTDTAGGWTAKCPCCKEVLKSSKPGELVKYVPTSVDPAKAMATRKREAARLDELVADVTVCRRVLADAQAAQMLVDSLPERPSPEELAEAIEAARIALEDQRIAHSDHSAAVAAQAEVAGAAQKTERARGYHDDLVAFTKLESAITSLPARFLEKALTALNARLATVSAPYAKPVQLGEDMELRYGTTRYALLSRSQQWRAELALGLAMSRDDGLVLMDEFDLIGVPDRGPILQMLSEHKGAQVVLGATLKEAPRLPDDMGIHAVWLGKSE